eukprot:157536-Pelagomonas_calceolata.AAC.8
MPVNLRDGVRKMRQEEVRICMSVIALHICAQDPFLTSSGSFLVSPDIIRSRYLSRPPRQQTVIDTMHMQAARDSTSKASTLGLTSDTQRRRSSIRVLTPAEKAISLLDKLLHGEEVRVRSWHRSLH